MRSQFECESDPDISGYIWPSVWEVMRRPVWRLRGLLGNKLCHFLGSRAISHQMLGGQKEAHFLEAKGFAEKEIISEDRRGFYKASLLAKSCACPVVWHSHVSLCHLVYPCMSSIGPKRTLSKSRSSYFIQPHKVLWDSPGPFWLISRLSRQGRAWSPTVTGWSSNLPPSSCVALG